MGFIRPSALLLGGLLAAPALWHGFVTGQLDVLSALVRFILGVLVAAVLLAVLRFVTDGYGPSAPRRRRTDAVDEAGPDVEPR